LFETSSLELQFFGVQGIVLEDDHEMHTTLQRINQNTNNQDILENLETQFLVQDQWLEQKDFNLIQSLKCYQLKINNIDDLQISKIRFRVKDGLKQRVLGFSIQAFGNQKNKQQYKAIVQQLGVYNIFY